MFPGIESASFCMKVTVFKIFSLSLVFSSLAVMCIGVIFFIFILCGFTEILVSVCECFPWCMWSLGPLFLQIFLSLYYSLFLGLNYSLPRLLDIVSWVAQPLFIFSIDYFKSHFRCTQISLMLSAPNPIKTWALCKFWMLDNNFLLSIFYHYW